MTLARPDDTSAAIVTRASVTKLTDADRDKVLIAGSHGGIYAGYLAALAGCRAVLLNDAGIGKDAAGIAALDFLDSLPMAAATIAHDSARIGDGQDMLARGRISHVNKTAAALGSAPGQSAGQCAETLCAATAPKAAPPEYRESRFLLEEIFGEPRVWGLDSASLVRPGDAGHVVITGSHGALMGGDPALAIRAEVLACAFNDAGLGADGAGISRLPALDGRGIAAVTLDCMSARIGDARSAWSSGRVSHANQLAAALSVRPGMSCQQFVDAVLKHQPPSA